MKNWIVLSVIVVLSLSTGLSWTVSQVMPDIFTAISAIIVVILIAGKLTMKEQALLYFLFLVSTAMHLSHISFNVALIAVLILIRLFNIKPTDIKFSYNIPLILLGLTAVAFTTMLSASAKSKHVFFMGAMVEHGILKIFLEENCTSNEFELCKYKDELPDRAFEFVWDEESPVYKMGSWKGTKNEFDKIIFATMTSPRYIGLHIKASLLATIEQLTKFRINDGNGVFSEGSLPYDRMKRYIPGELDQFSESKQMRNQFGFTDRLNTFFYTVIIITLILLLILIIFTPVFRKQFLVVLILFIVSIILNAWVSGTFANAIDRLGCKMIWLLPFVTLIGIAQFFFIKSGNVNLASE
jgi:hypothetical protein